VGVLESLFPISSNVRIVIAAISFVMISSFLFPLQNLSICPLRIC
jgi:hypothetical protein